MSKNKEEASASPLGPNKSTGGREMCEFGVIMINQVLEGRNEDAKRFYDRVPNAVDARGADQRNILHAAAHMGNKDLLEYALSGGKSGRPLSHGSVDGFDADRVAAVRMAVSNGAIDCVNYLLKKGADPLLENEWTDMPHQIGVAVELGRLDIVDALCKSGARLDPADQAMRVALRLVVEHNDPVTRKVAPPQIVNNPHYDAGRIFVGLLRRCEALRETVVAPNNLRVLAYAARRGVISAVAALLEAGASDDEPQDVNHWLPIHEAAAMGNAECLRLLVAARKKRVDVAAADAQDKAASSLVTMDKPQQQQQQQQKERKSKRNASNNNDKKDEDDKELRATAPRRYFRTVAEALSPSGAGGMTPILLAAMYGNFECVELLREAGAAVAGQATESGYTVGDLLVGTGKRFLVDETLMAERYPRTSVQEDRLVRAEIDCFAALLQLDEADGY